MHLESPDTYIYIERMFFKKSEEQEVPKVYVRPYITNVIIILNPTSNLCTSKNIVNTHPTNHSPNGYSL